MKLQYLAVIFIIIILPISMVFSEYINNQIEIVKTENSYNEKLLNSTYDAIKAYQLNTITNATSDIPASKIADLEAAVKTFYNSLASSFKYEGYKSSVMEEYVPAVVFSMYDGYYIYSPFYNTLTGVETGVADEYEDGKLLDGLKPYVYYNCRYKGTNTNGKKYDVIITYTLDNYITVEGTIGSDYVYDYGYLVDGITKNDNTYIYEGVSFSKDDTERLSEYLDDENEYYYTKIDGTKYYYSVKKQEIDDVDKYKTKGEDFIFYIDKNGERTKQVTSKQYNETKFNLYYKAIMFNKSAYVYYRDAYEFTYRVKNNYLSGLSASDAKGGYKLTDCSGIFEEYNITNQQHIEWENSKFNQHRMEVIRSVIQTNLETAIASYAKYSNNVSEFKMPKISETDWDLLTNNVCIATFMQGMSIGGKKYNGYSVVANNLTKEYVDENDIYILTNDGKYSRANDMSLTDTNIRTKESIGYYPGVLKLNFEKKIDKDANYYYPMKQLGSYTSIMGDTNLNSILYKDMYRYMKDDVKDDKLKTAYYVALGRERINSFNINNGGKEEEERENNFENWYYLKNYKKEYIE